MRPRIRRRGGVSAAAARVAVVGLLVLCGNSAAAEPARIRYRAPAACPGDAAMTAAVRERSTRAQDAAVAAPFRRVIDITITSTQAGFLGTLAEDSEYPET